MAGLYFHIPFCLRKCHYCDFYSLPASGEWLALFPDLLIRNLIWAANQDWKGPLDTVYFGGGTPSLLSPSTMASILEATHRYFGIKTNAEITLEANPGTLSQNNLADYHSAGINRLSLGLQSGSDQFLSRLGRLHDCREGLQAYRFARLAGFENISLDLMFALPSQQLSDLEEDIKIYLDLQPEHLSCYGLTVESNTLLQENLETGKLALPDESLYADMYMTLHQRLTDCGFSHYEISNYARTGFESQHNQNYWKRQPCLGIGPGAHSFQITNWGSRWEVPADLNTYHEALIHNKEPMVCIETFDRGSALRETIYLGLRTINGITNTHLKKQFGSSLQTQFPEAIKKCQPWLMNHDDRWFFKPTGWLIYDRLIQEFL
jgi:oxygen-independent coproporphyrinogen-3 oxidase